MARRDDILDHAAELLDLASFPDYGPQGMQVAGADEVTKIACAVSSSLELFERAAAAGAQLVLVHHGILWENEPRTIDRRVRRRLEALFAADLTLAAYHLALDAHPEIGNNALLARELGMEVDGPFAGIGRGGRLPEPQPLDDVPRPRPRADRAEPLVFADGPDPVGRVAILSGGGSRYLADAAREGYDLYLTGEPAEPSMHLARELGITFVAAGHYATERLGVQALAARLAERFDLEWEFLELPNPVWNVGGPGPPAGPLLQGLCRPPWAGVCFGHHASPGGAGPLISRARNMKASTEPVGALRRWAFHSRRGRSVMPNHLTPEELSKELGIERADVIRVCVEEGVPIYQGKIDKSLFQAQLQAIGAAPQKLERAGERSTFRAAARTRGGAGAVAGALPLFRLGDALLERLHQVDHRRLRHRLRLGDRLARQLRLEQLPQILAVLARQLLLRLERADEALDELPGQVELGLLDLVSSAASSISACE